MIAFLLLMFFVKCDPGPASVDLNIPENLPQYTVQYSDDPFSWDSLAIVESVIPLETTKESLIGDIYKAMVVRDTIFIMDFRNQRLLAFNMNGKFLGQIGVRGRGPREYLEVRDFDIRENSIYALDYRKIHRYNVATFEYEGNIQINRAYESPFNPIQFAFFGESDYFLWAGNPDSFDREALSGDFHMLIRVKDGKVVAKYYPYLHDVMDDNRFFRNSRGGYFITPDEDSYLFTEITMDKEFVMDFTLDFGNHNQPSLNGQFNIDWEKIYSNQYVKKIMNISQLTPNIIYYKCIGERNYTMEGVINLQDSTNFFGSINWPFNPSIVFSDNDNVFGYYHPSDVYRFLKSNSNNSFFDSFRKMIQNTQENDNPIFVKFRIK